MSDLSLHIREQIAAQSAKERAAFVREALARQAPDALQDSQATPMSASYGLRFALPYPPSVNHYWRAVRGRVLISAEGRRYRLRVGELASVMSDPTLIGPLALHLIAYPPDRRRRDVDNILKAVLDAMKHAKFYEDDSQVKWLLVEMREPVTGGKIDVWLAERTEATGKEK